jgi:hypothetical protein
MSNINNMTELKSNKISTNYNNNEYNNYDKKFAKNY